jgi:small-conductance mechanosensitive channel
MPNSLKPDWLKNDFMSLNLNFHWFPKLSSLMVSAGPLFFLSKAIMQQSDGKGQPPDQVVIPIRTVSIDKKKIDAEALDVWEEKPAEISSDTKLLQEAEWPSTFPMFLQYIMWMIVVGVALFFPAILVRGKAEGWLNFTSRDQEKEAVYIWSLLLTFSWIVACGMLSLISLVIALFGYVSKVSGRLLFGKSTLAFLGRLSKLRHGISIIVTVLVGLEFAKQTDLAPKGLYRTYLSLLLLGMLLFAKALLVSKIKTMYFRKYLGKQTAENRRALKLLGKLWNFFLHDFEISAKHTGSKRHENMHITDEQAVQIGCRLYQAISAHSQSQVIKPDHLRTILKESDANFMTTYLDIDRNGDLIQADFETGIQHLYEDRRQLHQAFVDSDKMIGKLDNLGTGFCLFFTMMVVIGLFGLSITNQVLVQVNLLVIMKFFFEDTFTKAFQCLTFVFFQHTIDVGDVISMSGREYRVKSIGLLDTHLENPDTTYISNISLSHARIKNFTRSPPQAVDFHLAVHWSTSREQLAKLEARLNKFIKTNPRDYLPDECYVKDIMLVNSEAMLFGLQYTQRSNFANADAKSSRHRKFIEALHAILKELNMRWAPYSLDLPRIENQ